MWTLTHEEIARKFLANELEGVWNRDLRVPEGMVALLLIDEKLDRVLGPGLVRVASGLAQFLGLGKKNTVVLARAHEITLDFPISRVLTKDPVFLDFSCQVVVKLQHGSEALFLANTLAGRQRLTLNDLKETLVGEIKEVAQSYLGKRNIAELANNIEIKPGLEAEIEINLKRTLTSAGLAFVRLLTADFRCQAWDMHKEAAVLITEEQAKLEGKKRLQEVFTQAELAELADETRKAELYERRIQLWDRMRHAAQSDKMNEVHTEQEFEDFLRSVDRDKLLKESEFEELKRNLKDKLEDKERARAHLVRIAELKNEYEYMNEEIVLRSGLTQAQQQAEAVLQVRRMEDELKLLDLQLAKKRKEDEIRSLEAADRKGEELADYQHLDQLEDMRQARESKKQAQERDEDLADLNQVLKMYKSWKETKLDLASKERLERAEAERTELESRERRMRLQLEWYQTLDTMSPDTKVLLAPDAQKAELLAGLAKIKAQASLSTEQLLAAALAANNSPQIADVLRTLVTKASSLEEEDLFERRVGEQKQVKDEMRAMSENFLKVQHELFNKTLEVLAQIARPSARGHDA